jgi:hypothetical protein
MPPWRPAGGPDQQRGQPEPDQQEAERGQQHRSRPGQVGLDPGRSGDVEDQRQHPAIISGLSCRFRFATPV